MKAATTFITCLLCAFHGLAQNNIIKANVSSAFLKNIHLQYEHGWGEKRSWAVGVRYQPNSNIPLSRFLDEYVGNEDIQFGSFKTSNIAITPEVRFYMGKKGGLTGFYIAPYLRYAHWKGNLPVSYESSFEKRVININGAINSYSAGVMIGSQYNISKNLVFDWWIAGGHVGISSGSGDYVTSPSMSEAEQSNLEQKLAKLDFWFVKFKADVSADRGTATTDGLWAGVRAFGFNLGYRF